MEKPVPQRLQAAALQLFWEKGYRATSTRDIAAALGVKQGSLYYYVKNKEDVLYAICYSALQYVLENVMKAASTAQDPVDGMRRILGRIFAPPQSNKSSSSSALPSTALSHQRVQQIKIFWRGHQLFVSAMLSRGKAERLIRRDIADRYLYFVTISTVHWTVLWFRSTDSLTHEQLVPLYTAVLVDGAASPASRDSNKLKRRHKPIPHFACHPLPRKVILRMPGCSTWPAPSLRNAAFQIRPSVKLQKRWASKKLRFTTIYRARMILVLILPCSSPAPLPGRSTGHRERTWAGRPALRGYRCACRFAAAASGLARYCQRAA